MCGEIRAYFHLARFVVTNGHAMQLLFDLSIAFRHLSADEIEHVYGLLEREQMLVPPIVLKAFGNFSDTGANMHVPPN